MSAIAIRPATAADVPEIQSIYGYHVLHGTGSFEEAPPSVEEMTRRFEAITGRGWDWLVARDATGVIGYAYYGYFRERAAYRFTVENSIYVRHDCCGGGIGRALGERLLQTAGAQGFRQMIAVIGDAANIGSIALHARLGFRQIGQLHAVGYKFGRWLDVIYMQRALGAEVPGS
jgi:L-amino acid N-acyltransferase YncA